MDLSEVAELLAVLCDDKTISKSVREALVEIKQEFDSDSGEAGVKVDSALARLEDLSIDPNLSADVRTKIWDLTSKLEGAANGK